MDVNLLKDVLILLEERNMTRAAARRNITQPAFSRRIRSFEGWLGRNILDRKTNRVELSAALTSNEAEIRGLVKQVTELRRKIVHFDAEASEITIAAQHSTIVSTFSDMLLHAKRAHPGIKIRLRAGNFAECLSLFLRGDAQMLLCYEGLDQPRLQFGTNVVRGTWGKDFLFPAVGVDLRSAVHDASGIPEDTPAIVYPDTSHFGEILGTKNRPFATARTSLRPLCETAFATGVYDMVHQGLGVGWLTYSMAHRSVDAGRIVSLARFFGQEHLDVSIYISSEHAMSMKLLNLWEGRQNPGGKS